MPPSIRYGICLLVYLIISGSSMDSNEKITIAVNPALIYGNYDQITSCKEGMAQEAEQKRTYPELEEKILYTGERKS
jgi:hypothetical protein